MSTLDFDFTERLYANYLANPSLQATENAVSHNGLLKSLETRQSAIDNDYVFSIDLRTLFQTKRLLDVAGCLLH